MKNALAAPSGAGGVRSPAGRGVELQSLRMHNRIAGGQWPPWVAVRLMPPAEPAHSPALAVQG
jgi:hypothetical protein